MMIANRIRDRLYEDVSLHPRSDRDVGSVQELYDLFECISKYPNGHVELVAVGCDLPAYVDSGFAGKGQHDFDHIPVEHPKLVLVELIPMQ